MREKERKKDTRESEREKPKNVKMDYEGLTSRYNIEIEGNIERMKHTE